MKTKTMSICFHTDKVKECKEFYTRYLNAKLTFDHEWYIVLNFESAGDLCFMVPQDSSPLFEGNGTTLNFEVENVDEEYKKLAINEKLLVNRELQDNPWGDRSFVINDPIGNRLYIYNQIPPTKEYKNSIK